ncbi:MAG: thiamine pyrophosphate-dependent enzyme [Prolixibacteraceae bacterium]|jgi:indolepyruvate ferredoxin oxidoreductase alpha subunit|nr:thiamine pyrophosphate-dependent enzyme [Prolixibacteraceae bacterium]
MSKQLLLGAEAVAQGAIDAGISGVYAYPGTPSTEITAYIQLSEEGKAGKIRSTWSANEKTAYEAALGMSYAGKRALVCMKHVGLNVAADAFINSAITGVNGGMVVTVADDPSMHSSQNEQDTRVYGKFAMVPVCEPANQQELYNSIFYAFNLSEEIKLPVIVRITTRLSHSRSGVQQVEKQTAQNELSPEVDGKKFVLLPGIARKRYDNLVNIQPNLENFSEKSPLNKLIEGGSNNVGVIAFGIAYNYTMEVREKYNLDFSVLKIGQYPLPRKMINDFFDANKQILIAEEGYPVYEELMRGYFNNNKIKGRLDNTLPRTGELDVDSIAKALGVELEESTAVPSIVAMRPPALCKGCGHQDVFQAMNMVLNETSKHVFSDIGCYTLGALPPYNAISSCVDMGASVTMAKGASDAGLRPAVAVIGDSTFTHSGITGLLDAVNDKSPLTLIISDNDTTAMTGGQDSSGTGKIGQICMGIGVEKEHIRMIVPLKNNLEENVKIMKEEFEYEGVSVIIANRECIQTAIKKRRVK